MNYSWGVLGVKVSVQKIPAFILTAALFTTAKLSHQPRCPTTDEWMEKMWVIRTMEFYSAIKAELN